MCLWAVTFSHSPVPCESHYTYCSHHSGRCCSSLTGSDHSQRLVKLRKPLMVHLRKSRQAGIYWWDVGFFFLPLFLGKIKKKNDFNGFRYFTLAVNGAVDGFLPRWGRGVINMSRLQLWRPSRTAVTKDRAPRFRAALCFRYFSGSLRNRGGKNKAEPIRPAAPFRGAAVDWFTLLFQQRFQKYSPLVVQ